MAYVRIDDNLINRTIEGGIPDTMINDTINMKDKTIDEECRPYKPD